MTRTALVVGAGIGGLSAAISLPRVGWNVRVFERAAAVRELGFDRLVAPNATTVLAICTLPLVYRASESTRCPPCCGANTVRGVTSPVTWFWHTRASGLPIVRVQPCL